MRTRTLIAIITLSTVLQAKAQQAYVDFSLDPNKVFGIIDNQRTATDHRGIDFDLEVGVINRRWAWFIYYGAFPEADYQNYGLGTDFRIVGTQAEWRAGVSLGPVVMQRSSEKNLVSGTWLAGNLRSLIYLQLFPGIGITGRIQFQVRPDIPEMGIFEGNLGVRLLIK